MLSLSLRHLLALMPNAHANGVAWSCYSCWQPQGQTKGDGFAAHYYSTPTAMQFA